MSRSKPLVIVYAEDDRADAFLFRRALRTAHANAVVRIVPDGEEAMQYMKGIGKYEDRSLFPFPDLIFIDWRMPIINGADFLKWCRQSPACESLTVVVVTGSNSPQEAKAAKDLGAGIVMFK